ncbi:MAG: acetate--CoA ligase family protein [Bacteroidales bacterium]|nr:acetate--CoA ligase family protein [Bacteroidales bacterium]
MVNRQLINPESIVVVGASNNIRKPGGKLFHNILHGSFGGELYAVNPGEDTIQGRPSFREIKDLPATELAILAIPAVFCAGAVKELARDKGTRAFIIVSAGFGEESSEGKKIESELVEICNRYNASLIGPNCIGVMTPFYQGVFTLPIPKLDPKGCDFISGSGATAVFIMEAGLQKGLKFNMIFSVGNSAQLGVEDVLQYLDETFTEESSRVKILYFESIKDPDRLLRHATNLIRKGCRIAAIKAGTSDAGSRAATSHTGAMASSDLAVDALFRKAGIIRCYGREELTTVASVLSYPKAKGRNFAIITHAGGPAVMLTDTLAEGNLHVPQIKGKKAAELLSHLFPGSSVSNPIDLLATGNAEQLGIAMEYCEKYFGEIDGIIVIFGTPGLFPVYDVYDVLDRKMKQCKKPVFPILPSVTTAAGEIKEFQSKGHINFPDEVLFGRALNKVYNTPKPAGDKVYLDGINLKKVRAVIDSAPDGYLDVESVCAILDAAGISRVREEVATDPDALKKIAAKFGYPVVLKVVGPVHKSDVGGVLVNIRDEETLMTGFQQMKGIEGYQGVLIQQMLEGTELFIGANYEPGFGHVVLCGLGGIYVEALKDVTSGLAPLSVTEAGKMIRSLKSARILDGTRGKEGVNKDLFAEALVRISSLLRYATEIVEMDLNPLIGRPEAVTVVDARIRVEKKKKKAL